ncbi:MAG: hypothetical protein ABFQ95_07235, partial [Pseudomonadota bacterium]
FGFLPTETTLFAYLKFSLPTQNAKEPEKSCHSHGRHPGLDPLDRKHLGFIGLTTMNSKCNLRDDGRGGCNLYLNHPIL